MYALLVLAIGKIYIILASNRTGANCIYALHRGSVIAKVVGHNVVAQPQLFAERVSMWVYEEVIDGRRLTDIINTEHENTR